MAFVVVRGLTFRYPDGTPALESVDFELAAGERVGLVGPNGAGKSTLLWHLNGLLPEGPSAGQGRGGAPAVTVGGLSVAEPNLAEVRRLVGLLFQDPDDQVFCPTVREDVAFGPLNQGLDRDEVLARVRQALAAVDLQGFEDRLPHHLSLGERRRVCLAGVLACRPQLLALDEPSANLDPRGRRQLLAVLAPLEAALLVASHDLELIVALCSRVIVLDGGRVRADGPTRQLLADPELMDRHGLEVPHSLR